jgi:hypothetical protein
MSIWRSKPPKEFQAEDLPKNAEGEVMAATFISNPKHPSLRVKLRSIEEEVHPVSGTVTRQEQTGFTAKFSGHCFHTKNKAMMHALLGHDAFNKGVAGYTIDHHDPTGLWQMLGIVEVEVVKTFVPKTKYKVDLSTKELSAKLKAAEKEPPEKTEALVGLAE